MTAAEIINAALQELGVLVSGGSPNANDLAWSLGKLNRFLKTLSADGLNIHYRAEESFDLVAGTAAYSIGWGGDFSTERPISIELAFIRDNDHDYPLGIHPISEYWQLREKTTQSRPVGLYYDPTFSTGTVYLYFTPDSAYSLHLVSQKPLLTYLNSATDISLPGEYEDALVLNLAIRMASRYGISTSRELQMSAKEAMGNVKALNLSQQMKSIDLGIPGVRRGSTYNVDSDC